MGIARSTFYDKSAAQDDTAIVEVALCVLITMLKGASCAPTAAQGPRTIASVALERGQARREL